MKSKRLTLTAIVFTVLLTGGCVNYNYGAAFIQSTPVGAEVVNLEDDTVLGVTPVKVWWRHTDEERKFINVRLQRQGNRDKTTSFWVSLRHSSKKKALKEPQLVEVQMDPLDN